MQPNINTTVGSTHGGHSTLGAAAAAGIAAGGATTPQKTGPGAAALAELRTSLLKLEDKLPWTCVTRAFSTSRSAWRKEVAGAPTLRHFVRAYKDFLPFLKIEQHLPQASLQCTAQATLDALQRCADAQARARLLPVFVQLNMGPGCQAPHSMCREQATRVFMVPQLWFPPHRVVLLFPQMHEMKQLNVAAGLRGVAAPLGRAGAAGLWPLAGERQ